jgi:pilus assembly protein CpaF
MDKLDTLPQQSLNPPAEKPLENDPSLQRPTNESNDLFDVPSPIEDKPAEEQKTEESSDMRQTMEKQPENADDLLMIQEKQEIPSEVEQMEKLKDTSEPSDEQDSENGTLIMLDAPKNKRKVVKQLVTSSVIHRTPMWEDGGEYADLLYSEESMEWMQMLHNEILDCMARTDIREIDRNNPEHVARLEGFLEEVITKYRHKIPEYLPTEVFMKALRNEIIGHGPITELLENEKITEIMVNGPDKIFIEIGGAMYITPYKFFSEERLIAMIRGIVEPLGRRVDASSPMVDARLEDGSRVNAIIPPLALDGASVTIRKFSKKKLTVDDLIDFGSMDKKMAAFLKLAVEKRQNIVVSGGTGSGKTTLLNVLSDFIPGDQRVVTIEDSAELKLNADNIVRLEARPANVEGIGRVSIRDLVINALRMRPDRIVVGECRGAEALDMLQAMNTGHDGSLTTLHANNPRDALARLENMVMMAGFELPVKAIREQIASAVNLIVHQSRMPGHSRKIVAITEVTRMEEDKILMQDIFTFEQTKLSTVNGKTILEGYYKPTGNIPEFVDAMLSAHEDVDGSMFVEDQPQEEYLNTDMGYGSGMM